MKRLCSLICLATCVLLPFTVSQAAPIAATGTVEVFFSPHGGATEAIIKEINAAAKEILVQAYSLTSGKIKDALVQARKRGVRVEVLLDFSQAELDSSAGQLSNNDIPVFVDTENIRNHDKIMIIDHKTIITGSFDFTRTAEEKSIENLLIIKDNIPLAEKYQANYAEHRSHSKPYVRYPVK